MFPISRKVSYLFWTFVEQTALMALPRLVLWPIAAYMVGKESFGIFVFAFAIASILGLQPGNGLATGLLRHLSDYEEPQQRQFSGIALRLCHKAMVVIVGIGMLVFSILGAADLISRPVVYCLIPLILSLYAENQTHLLLTECRFHRQFKQRAIWFTVRSIVNIIGGVAGAKVAGLMGLVWGFSIGNMIVYAILRVQYQEWFRGSYDAKMAGILKKVWLQITIAGIIAIAGPYLNRIILGSIHGFNDTADLVAATSVTFIFLAPITGVSGLLLSIISRYSSIKDLSRQSKIQLFCVFILGAVVCPAGLRLFASRIMNTLYPNFGEASVQLLNILIWMLISETVVNLCRPFVMKFGSVRLVPIINGASLVATLVPAFCLIPVYGTVGAAWAIVVGSIVTGGLWLIATTWVYFRSTKKTGKMNCRIMRPLYVK